MRPPALRPGPLVALLAHLDPRPPMPPKRDPNNPNAAHLAKPYHQARPMMREQSQSQRIRTSQARIATVNPGKITLPELPKWLREPERKRP